ncbi:MAG TPA: 50S ribosomal protein L21 [Gemmatimonadetes bacterium]|nr:50S ribosomal protein L21 [Gemmatimonadota bacterium]
MVDRGDHVEEGVEHSLEKLPNAEGDTITFDEVLLFRDDNGVRVGTPLVEGVSVQGTVLEQARTRKILVFKFKRRKNYKRLQGHRQQITKVRIDKIKAA